MRMFNLKKWERNGQDELASDDATALLVKISYAWRGYSVVQGTFDNGDPDSILMQNF
jgi:hypothetical protein